MDECELRMIDNNAEKQSVFIDYVYGELVLLGFNGSLEYNHAPKRKHHSKVVLHKRLEGNGLKKGRSRAVGMRAAETEAVRDCTRHVVSYAYCNAQTVLVEYGLDPTKDMFQIGRSSEKQIDFTIVDTSMAGAVDPAHRPDGKCDGNEESRKEHLVTSTISRYACRIQIDREEPNRAFLCAAGFDNFRNIFLGEKATKWIKGNGEIDGLTTNGILILNPRHAEKGDDVEEKAEMFVWREVSVDGGIYKLRETRSSVKTTELIADETNELQDGTLIDLCGATLLWRTAEGLKKSPNREQLEFRLDEINAGKPQCPVNFNTLIIPRKKSANDDSQRQPYVYINCGHVQGKHLWGVQIGVDNDLPYKCPICLVSSPRILQLVMGMESAFHLDSESLDNAFNPCGHVASLATVRYWSRIPLPHGLNCFHSKCPFCKTFLSNEKPYLRLIFQDHC